MRAFYITVFLVVLLVCMPALGRRHGRKHGLYHHHSRHQQAVVEETATKKGTVSALPGLNVLLSSKENGVEFKIGECKVKVAMEGDCKYTLTPSPDTCGGTIPFASILNHFLPKNDLGEKSKTFVLPDKFDLKFLEIDKCKTTINFKAQAREKLDLIPGKLSIEGASLALIINYKTGAVDWELLELDIAGSVTFADKKLPITVKKKTKQSAVTFSFKTDQVTIPSIVGKFSSKNEVAPPETDKEVVGKVTSVVIKNPTLSGIYDPKGFYELVVSGEPQGKIFQSSSFYIIIQKAEDSDVKAAVAAKLNLFSPATLLSELTGKDLTKIPLLKELVLNFAFAISNDDFAAIKDEKLAKEIGGFIKGEKTIQKGARLYFDVPIKETFKKLAPDLKVDDFPPSLFMKVTIGKEGIKFKFPDEWKTDLLKILKGLAPKLKEYLPKWLQSDGPPLITINDFAFDYKTLAFTIDVMAKGPFNLGKILSLYNVSLKVSHKGEDSPYEFSFSSSQTLFGETLLTTKLTKSGADKYEFVGSISMIRTGQLIKALGVKFLSEETVKKLSFLDFGMSDVKLTARFGSQFYIGLSGKVILFGWDGVEFEGIIYQDAGMPVMALGLVINKIRLDEIVDKLFKKKLAGITWLSELNVVITMSTTDATPNTKDLKFTNPTLQAVGLKKGVMFRAVANIPADCKGDKICEMSKEVTKDEKTARALTIEGQITPSGVELKGTYAGNWELGKNVRIPNVKLVLKIGAETKVYFEVTVNIIEPKLELQGTVGIGGTGSLQLSAKMKGIWKEAFGIKFLSFGNLAFSIGIVPGVAVSEFAFEGELRLGAVVPAPAVKPKPALERRAAEDAGNQIVSKASLGINMVKPMDTYFYAEISKFTIGAVVKAFGLDMQLPKALMETGFPDGVIVSFAASPKGKDLPTLKTKIESGFSFQGKINLLGYEVYVNCRISYKPVKFALVVEMSPIKIAKGLIALQRSEKEADKGPMFQAVIAASGTQIKIKGYITVLGISAGVSIDVSDNGFEFSLSGNLFDVVRADVTIKGKYGDIKTTSFEVSACIKTGPADVQKEVKTTLEVAGKEATETMGEANKKASKIGDLYLESKEGVTKMDGEIQEFQDKLRKKGKSISEAKKILNEKCIDECSTECIGGPDWDPKCLEIDGGFIGCPVWNDCKFKAPDYVCIAKCKGKKTLGVLKAKVKQKALDALLFILKGIKRLFNIGKKFFQTSQKLLNTAKDVLKEAGDKLKAGLDAAKAAASTAVEKLVQIHSMCFQTGLDEAAKACVGLKINATFFQTKKVQFDTEGCLDVSFAKTIAQSISDKLYPGIKALKDKIGELKAKFGLMETEKDNVEATADEAKKACKGDDEEACAMATERSTIWTEEEDYYRRLAYEQLPRFTLRDGDTLSKFERDTPTIKASLDDAMARAVISNEDMTVEVAKKRESVTDDSNHKPCARASGTVRALHEFTKGLKGLADSHKKQHKSFHDVVKAKKNKINRLALGIRSECFYYSCTPENLHDALYYVRKAKKEISTWEQTVRSQIHRQGNQTFSFWKRQLDANARKKRGFGIAQYLKDLSDAGKQFQTRTGIADDDPKNEALQQFAKDFTALMTDDMPLSKAIPTIEKLATKIADVDALKENCGE